MNIVRPTLPPACRIICTSDIHAYLDDFKALLEECEYDSESDYLFILGDIIEKGPHSIDTLNYVQELCQNPNVQFIQGNHDAKLCQLAYTDDQADFLAFMRSSPDNTFMQMAETLGITDFTENFEQKRQKVIEAYKSQIDFIQNAPLAIEIPRFIFVHAGIESRPDWENTAPRIALSLYPFMYYGHQQQKIVVCGHCPTYNLQNSNNTNLPVYDKEKRILDIDGGMGTNSAMQLNAMIITLDGDRCKFRTLFHPHGEEVIIVTDAPTEKRPKFADRDKHRISVTEDCGEFLLVRNTVTGDTGLIPEAFTREADGLYPRIYLDAFLSVKAGEKFYISHETENHLFGIAQNGKVGFIPKSALIPPPEEENGEDSEEENEEASSEEENEEKANSEE